MGTWRLAGIRISVLGALGCYEGAADRGAPPPVVHAPSIAEPFTARNLETAPPALPRAGLLVPESELQMLHRLRAHYRGASSVAHRVASVASSPSIAREADWLVLVYDHVAEHFDTALLDWYGSGEAEAPDPPSSEFTPMASPPSRTAELRFAEEALTAHRELVRFVRSPAYSGFAEGRELLREIRFDVETSQSAQLDALHAVVTGGPPL